MRFVTITLFLVLPLCLHAWQEASPEPSAQTEKPNIPTSSPINSEPGSEGHPAITTIHVGLGPQGIAFTPDGIWVGWGDDKNFGVSRLDPRTHEIVATIRTGKWPVGVAVGEGSVWVVNHHGDSVTRIDPQTNQVIAVIPVGKGPLCIAVGEGSVWVTNGWSGSASRIDPHTNTIVATVPVGRAPSGIVVSNGAAWVAVFGSGWVSRIDLKSNKVEKSILMREPCRMTIFGPQCPTQLPNQIVAAAGSIWVTAQDERVFRIDPQSNKITAVIQVPPSKPLTKSLFGGLVHVPNLPNLLPHKCPGKPTGLAITGDVMWVADWANDVLWKVDIPTGKTFGVPVPVGSRPLILGPGNDGTGAFWLSNSGDATIMQIKPNLL